MNTHQQYNGALRVRRKYGMRGYGIYTRIVELIQSAPDKRIRYDVDDLVFDMREDAETIKDVVENFGLFTIKDGFLEDPYLQTQETPVEARREPQQAQETKHTQERPRVELATFDAIPEQSEPTEPEEEVGRSEISQLFDAVKAEWNKVFARSYRVYRDIIPDAITWNNFVESSKVYSLPDFKDAFARAKTDKFNWQFKDVLKPANMQRLLSLVETERQAEAAKRAAEDDKLTDEQKEVIQYADSMGWNW